jgi:Ca2+-binding EF-hand superfamily protein
MFDIIGIEISTPQHCQILFAAVAATTIGYKWYISSRGPDHSAMEELKSEMSEGKGTREGAPEEMVNAITRICALFHKLDVDGSNSIEMSEIKIMGYGDTEAQYLMKSLDSNNDGSISCDEFISYFNSIKSDFGIEKMQSHLSVFENAFAKARSEKAAPKKSINSSATSTNEFLPSTWVPTMTSRVASVYRRIDMNGDNSIEKKEILALQGGNEQETEFMFNEIDTDGDGSISNHEFLEYFLNIVRKRNADELSKGVQIPKKGKIRVQKILNNLEQKLNERDLAMIS